MRGTWLGDNEDADRFRRAIKKAKLDWHVDTTHPDAAMLRSIRHQLISDYDFVVLPLSLIGYWSFRLPELANQEGSTTRLILWSRSDADPQALGRLFDAHFDRRALFADIIDAIQRESQRERHPAKTAALIHRILESSPSLWVDGEKPSIDDVREYEIPRFSSEGPVRPQSRLPAPDSQRRPFASSPLADDRLLALEEKLGNVFVSYAHEDEGLRRQLGKHLSSLERQGLIATWHDRMISAGTEWQGTIDDRLEEAGVVLLLVSSDFVNSSYCYDVEMRRALERHEARDALVIPIVLRPVLLRGLPFARLQALPRDAKPVTDWPTLDSAFVNITEGLRDSIATFKARLPNSGLQQTPSSLSLGRRS
ncbi:MAG TPA: toll/interleukin-1 receptor domain-containing protein [Polyangiaceae bacterium]|nr:toll/interleukin-1 receptor domain-containing protein [Polyangiaceae bacterium]